MDYKAGKRTGYKGEIVVGMDYEALAIMGVLERVVEHLVVQDGRIEAILGSIGVPHSPSRYAIVRGNAFRFAVSLVVVAVPIVQVRPQIGTHDYHRLGGV